MLLTHTSNPRAPSGSKPHTGCSVPVCEQPALSQHSSTLAGACWQSQRSLACCCKRESKPKQMPVVLSLVVVLQVLLPVVLAVTSHAARWIISPDPSSAYLLVPGLCIGVPNQNCRLQELPTCIYQQSPPGYKYIYIYFFS